MRTRSDGARTRERILQAAADVFAERGFRDATHAEIARRSGLNSALMNYHFTDKETLYAKAWEFAERRTAEKYPLDGGVPAEAAPEARLRGRIAAMIRAAADPESADQEIWRKELAQPTGLLTEIRQKTVLPLRRGVARIVRELLGEGASDETVRLATMSVIAQCRIPVVTRRESSETALSDPEPFIAADLETRIDHIWRFSLGGISTLIRSRAEIIATIAPAKKPDRKTTGR